MSYDDQLAQRIREQLAGAAGLSEKRMFGGLAFLVDGRMAVCAIRAGGLMLRVDPAHTGALVSDPHVRRFVMRGRELDGWLHIDSDALVADGELAAWVRRGVGYARSLPPR